MSRVQEIRDKYKVLTKAIVDNIDYHADDEKSHGFKARSKEFFDGIISPEKQSLIASAYTTLLFTYRAIYAVGRANSNNALHLRLHELEANLLEQLENDNNFKIIKIIYDENTHDKELSKAKIKKIADILISNELFITTCHRFQYSTNYELFSNALGAVTTVYKKHRKRKTRYN